MKLKSTIFNNNHLTLSSEFKLSCSLLTRLSLIFHHSSKADIGNNKLQDLLIDWSFYLHESSLESSIEPGKWSSKYECDGSALSWYIDELFMMGLKM